MIFLIVWHKFVLENIAKSTNTVINTFIILETLQFVLRVVRVKK